MALGAPLEAVEENKQGCAGWAVEVIDIDEIAIRRIPTFTPELKRSGFDEQWPDRLGVPAG